MTQLFQATKLGQLEVKNRIFMAPMTRSRANNTHFAPTDLMATYYGQRASAGLIISEGVVVSPRGTGYVNVPGIYSVQQIEAWKKVTAAVHQKGGKIFAQLWHVGRRSHPDFLGGKLPLAPSAINPNTKVFTPTGMKPSRTPHALSIAEIQEAVEQFVQAAKNAIAAGFDGIEVHASNGYIFHQFFSAHSNIRKDIYGGSDENKSRILWEVLDRIQQVIPAKQIGVRLNPMLHGMRGTIVDEQTATTFDYIVQQLNNYDLAYLHLTRPTITFDAPYFIKDVIGHYRKIYRGFLVANGDYTAESGEQELASSRADAIAYGRPFIANPDLVERFKNKLPLALGDQSTFYTTGAKGYTDYPFYN